MTTSIPTMRLRLVVTADFRKTEATNWYELEAAGEIPRGLKPSDVVCMVNSGRTQIVFVWPPYEHGMGQHGKTVKIVASRRMRIAGASWNPLELQNYAEDCGFRLAGFQRFEEHYKAMRAAEREARHHYLEQAAAA